MVAGAGGAPNRAADADFSQTGGEIRAQQQVIQPHVVGPSAPEVSPDRKEQPVWMESAQGAGPALSEQTLKRRPCVRLHKGVLALFVARPDVGFRARRAGAPRADARRRAGEAPPALDRGPCVSKGRLRVWAPVWISSRA